MWRPKNWKQIIPKYPYTGYPTYRDGAIAIWEEAIEVGATAILEAQKENAHYVKNQAWIDDPDFFGRGEVNGRGWLSFIPDKEVKNG